MYNNGKTVSGEKLFASYELVFELAKGLCDCQNNYIRTNKVGVLVKNETNKVYDLELYFELHSRKPPLKFDFPETELSLRFIWFEKFPWICYSCSMGGWNLLSVFWFIWS